MCSSARNPGESRPLPWPSPARMMWYSYGVMVSSRLSMRTRIIEHLVGAPQQPRCISEVAFVNALPGTIQFPRRALHQQFRRLMRDLKRQLVGMQHLLRRFLQRQ